MQTPSRISAPEGNRKPFEVCWGSFLTFGLSKGSDRCFAKLGSSKTVYVTASPGVPGLVPVVYSGSPRRRALIAFLPIPSRSIFRLLAVAFVGPKQVRCR